MRDTIERLLADIVTFWGTEGAHLVERAEVLWCGQESENAALRAELNKAKALMRIKDAKIRELEWQIADRRSQETEVRRKFRSQSRQRALQYG